jgi:Arc-like DNA binding dprotein
MPKSKEAPHLRVRIEPRLLARLEKARERTGRTMTGEIVERLRQSFQREDQQELAVNAVTTALQRAGFPVVPIGAPARDEVQAEPGKPANSSQKDKGT